MTTKKKELLLHVYDEVSDEEALRGLTAEKELRAEYETLAGMRVLLKRHRARHAPSAQSLERIMDTAGAQVRSAAAAPRPAAARMRLVYQAVSIAAVLVVGLFIGIFLLAGGPTEENAPVLASEPAPLEWDTGDDIRALHRRMMTIQGASELTWDAPPVPLESLPATNRTQGIIPANSN